MAPVAVPRLVKRAEYDARVARTAAREVPAPSPPSAARAQRTRDPHSLFADLFAVPVR